MRPLAFFGMVCVNIAGCGDPRLAPDQEPVTTTCTLVGCDNVVAANFLGLLPGDAALAPLTLDVCLDQACLTATVTVVATVGAQCETNDLHTACCAFTPAALGTECFAIPGGEVVVWLPVAARAYSGAVHTVHATVRDHDGHVLLSSDKQTTLAEFEPNGPQCAPMCFQSGVDFMVQ